MTPADHVAIAYHGSVVLVRPRTDDAHAWLERHTPDDATWFGGALVVEPRYLADLIDGLAADLTTTED
jgi:hypothetical protein